MVFKERAQDFILMLCHYPELGWKICSTYQKHYPDLSSDTLSSEPEKCQLFSPGTLLEQSLLFYFTIILCSVFMYLLWETGDNLPKGFISDQSGQELDSDIGKDFLWEEGNGSSSPGENELWSVYGVGVTDCAERKTASLGVCSPTAGSALLVALDLVVRNLQVYRLCS